MRTIVFELCAETVQACLAAREGGADRIELCSALSEGGLTPSHGLIRQAMEQSGLPVHVMLRPRGGDFVYTDDEFAVLLRDLIHVRQIGVRGVVLGVLRPDGTIDAERTAKLVRMAHPLEVTFHRAFDEVPDLAEALEELIAVGCRRVLTAGGEDDIAAGALTLLQLVKQAAGRIEVAVGGGLRLHNAAELVRATGATHFHGSMRRFSERRTEVKRPKLLGGGSYVDSADVRAVIATLTHA